MTIVNRMSRMIKADIHGIMDKVEEPKLMLKHALREMDELIEKEEEKQRNLASNLVQIDDHEKKLKSLFDASNKQLQMCLGENNEDLAKKIVRKKLEIERQFQLNGERRQEIIKQSQYVNERLEEWRARRNEIVSQIQLADLKSDASMVDIEGPVSDDDVEIAYLEELKKFKDGENQ